MSFLSDIKNSVSVYSVATTGNTNIFGGVGNAYIETHTGNADIITRDGNHTMSVDVNNALYIDTGCRGEDNIYGSARYAQMQTYGDDDTVVLNCESMDLDIGDGNDNVIVSATDRLSILGGDGDKAIIAEAFGTNNNYIAVGNGNKHVIEAMGNNFGIAVGNGDLTLGTVGNNQRIVAGDGNHTIGFYGNNVKIDVGNGTLHDIRTLDNWISAGSFTQVYNASDLGIFNHNIGLSNTLSRYIPIATNETTGDKFYMVNGVANAAITTGTGTLQGLMTVSGGDFSVKTANEIETTLRLNNDKELLSFKAGELRANGGYLLNILKDN